MKITYDPEVDILRILLSETPIDESDEDKPGVILDYDAERNVVGVEVLEVSKRADDADTLYINFKKPSHATDSELADDDVIVRYDGDEVIGLTILHVSQR